MICGWHRYMKLCHTREELARLPQGPKLVLATLPSLHAGCARDLFLEWAPDPKNLILFSQQAEVWFLTPQQTSTHQRQHPACLCMHKRLLGVDSDGLTPCKCTNGLLSVSWAAMGVRCTPVTVLSEHASCLEEQEGLPLVHVDLVLLGWFYDTLDSCKQSLPPFLGRLCLSAMTCWAHA